MTKTIATRYTIIEELGSGGMGTVYKATDNNTQQTVAIKQLHPKLTNAELIERFKREGEALRDLNHPNIVKMLDAVEQENAYYLIMEYIAGGDLADLIQSEELSLERIIALSIDLADALTRAHKLGIIHRDLKPANILIGDDDVLRLTDFGVAFVGSQERITETDAIVGTVDYLPPEAVTEATFDARGDIWAFGVILFEMLTGERPFKGETLIQTIASIANDPIPDLENIAPDVSIALVDLVYRMLERNVDERIRSVRQVGLELEDILQNRTIGNTKSPRFKADTNDIFAVKLNNLPAETMPFVGRETELSEIARLVSDPSKRQVTIIAPGGMGKTRLALAAAQHHLDQFDDGVYFVELAPLNVADQIPAAIAAAMDFKFQQADREAWQELLDYLATKKMLLVLDNFEHLLDGATRVTNLIKQTSSIQVLVTSRQRLALPGEIIIHLSGMEFADLDAPEQAMQYAAVKLFVNSAQRTNPAFELTPENVSDVGRICTLVQGMPLGIVLSGAWVEMLSPQEIASELEQSIDILADEIGELPERQQSIRAVMGYAWATMSVAEQSVFMRLSVFKGGFTREAAQAVAGASLRTLMSLVTKSLLRRNADSGRYEIHELLRQYGYEQLEANKTVTQAYEQHADYFSTFLTQQVPLLRGGGQMKSLVMIDSDYENCYLAWTWAVENGRADLLNRMLEGIHLYCQFRFQFDTGYRLFELARQRWSLSASSVSQLAGRLALRFTGTEDPAITQPIIETCLAIAEQKENSAEIAFCQRELGRSLAHHTLGDKDTILQGIEHLQLSLKLYRELDDIYMEAVVLDDIGYAFARIGDEATRNEYSGRSLELRKQNGDIIGYGGCISGYVIMHSRTNTPYALELLEEARTLAYQTNSTYLLSMVLPTIGITLLYMERHNEALETFQTGHQLALAHSDERLRIIVQFGMVMTFGALNTDLAKANEYIREIRPAHPLITKDSQIKYFYEFAILHYALRTHNGDMLANHIDFWVHQAVTYGANMAFVIMIPIYAYLAGKRYAHIEKAVEWLAFCETSESPRSPRIYMKDWSNINDILETCRQQLGDEQFTVHWEIGKSRDLQTITDEVIEIFVDER